MEQTITDAFNSMKFKRGEVVYHKASFDSFVVCQRYLLDGPIPIQFYLLTNNGTSFHANVVELLSEMEYKRNIKNGNNKPNSKKSF